MKALSVKQPWAELEAARWKGIEVRSVPTHHRGQTAIHASLRYDAGPDALAAWMEYRQLRDPYKATQEIRALPVGRVVAVVNLADCRPLEKADEDSACVPWRPNAWGWRLADVKRADTGIPVKGQLGLWTIPDAWITVAQEAPA